MNPHDHGLDFSRSTTRLVLILAVVVVGLGFQGSARAAMGETAEDAALRKALKDGRMTCGYPKTDILEFVVVTPGPFTMGRTAAELAKVKAALNAYHNDFSSPEFRVEILAPFLMSRAEITNRDFDKFLRDRDETRKLLGAQQPSAILPPKGAIPPAIQKLREANKPANPNWSRAVSEVTWDDAVEFCEWLSEATGYTVRLPTEIEWEYAARGPFGASSGPINVRAQKESWCGAADLEFGLNEWCVEVFDDRLYDTQARNAPIRFQSWAIPVPHARTAEARRPIRGGASGENGVNAEPSTRRWKSQSSTSPTLGFRPIIVVPQWILDPNVSRPVQLARPIVPPLPTVPTRPTTTVMTPSPKPKVGSSGTAVASNPTSAGTGSPSRTGTTAAVNPPTATTMKPKPGTSVAPPPRPGPGTVAAGTSTPPRSPSTTPTRPPVVAARVVQNPPPQQAQPSRGPVLVQRYLIRSVPPGWSYRPDPYGYVYSVIDPYGYEYLVATPFPPR